MNKPPEGLENEPWIFCPKCDDYHPISHEHFSPKNLDRIPEDIQQDRCDTCGRPNTGNPLADALQLIREQYEQARRESDWQRLDEIKLKLVSQLEDFIGA